MGGGLQDFSVSPRPLCFGFLGLGLRGLGPGLDKNKQLEGLTKYGAFNREHVVFCPTVFRNLPRDLGV